MTGLDGGRAPAHVCPVMATPSHVSPFAPGTLVIVYLQNPREKIWGVLGELNAAGVALTGLGLHSFDDWLRSMTSTEEPEIRPSSAFYPLMRVEKILLDEGADGVPSLDAQCAARTGMGLREHLSRLSGEGQPQRAIRVTGGAGQ